MNLIFKEREEKMHYLKTFLTDIDNKILTVIKELNWDYEKLLKEETTMVTCSINPQHKVPVTNIKTHEEKCVWHQQGYHDDDKPFSEFFGSGSCISLNPSILKSITEEPGGEEKAVRDVPQTSANLDQNFSRQEKLAIYDYVIANTKKQKSFTDLSLQLPEKNEKKEMTEWEIAAAERDAKRRRASYRNKVHTNRKTHTEILKEVIEIQMEALKEETNHNASPSNNREDHKRSHKKHKKDKYSNRDSPERRDRKDKHDKRNCDRHSKHKDRSRKRSPPASGSNSNSRSRSRDKYRKYESYSGRSHSHKSSKYSDTRQG